MINGGDYTRKMYSCCVPSSVVIQAYQQRKLWLWGHKSGLDHLPYRKLCQVSLWHQDLPWHNSITSRESGFSLTLHHMRSSEKLVFCETCICSVHQIRHFCERLVCIFLTSTVQHTEALSAIEGHRGYRLVASPHWETKSKRNRWRWKPSS